MEYAVDEGVSMAEPKVYLQISLSKSQIDLLDAERKWVPRATTVKAVLKYCLQSKGTVAQIIGTDKETPKDLPAEAILGG